MTGADEFWAWLKVGQDKGWISEGVCQTHDGVPMTDEEEAEFEDGGDPCVPVIRVWL